LPSSPGEQLADFISGTPADAITSIAEALESGLLAPPYLAMTLRQIPGVTDEKAMQASSAFSSSVGVLSPPALAVLLRTSDRLRRAERLDRPEIEVAWTGPDAEGPLVRPTRMVVAEMLRGVREAGEVLLVGYSFSAPEGSAMADIVDLLEEAARRRARLTLVLHKDEESANRGTIQKLWDIFVKKPRVMTWTPPPDHPYTKLHAKVLIVDRVEMLVGSANFTFHGLEANLELGLRVRGPQAREVAERFDDLIAGGVIRDWS
jgi:phosphatidylserine/phosphatidylglycerophosphate/cardiolipin synthase-like enzyme